jgi:hypothetical protein
MRICWLAGVAGLGLAGCHSAFVDADVVNRSGAPLSVVEVDYPSASFGTESLADGADYRYRFKVQGSGALKVLWTDAKQVDHTVSGPRMNEGVEGGLRIVIEPSGAVDWKEDFKK